MKTLIGGREVDAVIRFKSPDIALGQDELLQRVGRTNLPVLITGESGTGKELLARAIHLQTVFNQGPFVAVDCAALAPSLAEAELFGYRKGSFTGAVISKAGLLACADGGTIFLDEIGELPLELQPKLLRVLQEREIHRIGGVESVQLDVRVIAATNVDLWKRVAEGRFRDGLYCPSEVSHIPLPPLRDRLEDI